MTVRELMAEPVKLEAVTHLLLVKLQVFTINSSEGFCDRVCNGVCL